MSNQPPSDEARLLLFCELVDAYDKLVAPFPLQRTISVAGDKDGVQRDAITLRAALLRKFIYTSSDPVHVSHVLAALARCVPGPKGNGVVARFERDFNGRNWLGIIEGKDQPAKTVDDLTQDYLYGGLLHGDWDRWQRSKARGWSSISVAAWDFVLSGERFIRQLAKAIRLGAEGGRYDLDSVFPLLKEQFGTD